MLDDDGDGVIGPLKINLSEIDQRVLQIIAPLLNEMEELNAMLNQDEFLESMDRLFKVTLRIDVDSISCLKKYSFKTRQKQVYSIIKRFQTIT